MLLTNNNKQSNCCLSRSAVGLATEQNMWPCAVAKFQPVVSSLSTPARRSFFSMCACVCVCICCCCCFCCFLILLLPLVRLLSAAAACLPLPLLLRCLLLISVFGFLFSVFHVGNTRSYVSSVWLVMLLRGARREREKWK